MRNWRHIRFRKIKCNTSLPVGSDTIFITNEENKNLLERFKALIKDVRFFDALKKELGEDYLQKEKERQKNLTKEIIIAIENQKI